LEALEALEAMEALDAMIDKMLGHKALIQEKLEKQNRKRKNNHERKSNMWSDFRIMSVTCTRDIFRANMRLRLHVTRVYECRRNGKVI
jgi:hypothetical protein